VELNEVLEYNINKNYNCVPFLKLMKPWIIEQKIFEIDVNNDNIADIYQKTICILNGYNYYYSFFEKENRNK